MQIESKIVERHKTPDYVYLLVELPPKRIIIYSIFKRKDHLDDIPPIHKFKAIEISTQLLCEYSLCKYSNNTQIHMITKKQKEILTVLFFNNIYMIFLNFQKRD